MSKKRLDGCTYPHREINVQGLLVVNLGSVTKSFRCVQSDIRRYLLYAISNIRNIPETYFWNGRKYQWNNIPFWYSECHGTRL